MAEFLKNIQQKPKHIRVRIFAVVMMISAFTLFSLWLSLSIGRVGDVSIKGKDGKSMDLPTISESVSANLRDIFNIDSKK